MSQSNIEKRGIELNNAELFPHLIALMDDGHTITLKLKGFSMRPFLENNRDSALLTKAKNACIGDPVLAEIAPGTYVLHRIISIDGVEVTLLGDGNITTEHCRKEDIKAQVVGFYRKGNQKLDSVDGMKWKVYSKCWMFLRPIRRYLLGIYRRWVKCFGPV